MKTILVPTDFSTCAENAAVFAVELNKKFGGKVVLFHSYTVPIYATEVPMPVPSEYEMKKDAVKALNQLRSKLSINYPDTDFHCKTDNGFAENKIVQMEKEVKANYVVMGTRGAGGLRELLVGSNTAAVISSSVCPVIAVPENAKCKGLDKIVFAANYAEGDFRNAFEVVSLAREFNAEVILLHIEEDATYKAFDFSQLESFRIRIQRESNYPKISARLLEDKDILDGLNRYIEEVNAGLLAVTMRHRSFMQRLFSRSLTKRLAYHTHIPLMAFHTAE
jgi:nucleotide-binding universal stress UspA family protein